MSQISHEETFEHSLRSMDFPAERRYSHDGGREGVERRLAAILAADVVGYSPLMGEDEEGTLARLQALLSTVLCPGITGFSDR